MSDKKVDLILHWGELTAWLGQDWKSAFKGDVIDEVLPRGSGRNFAAYSDAIKSKYGYRPINTIAKKRGIGEGSRIGIVGFSETCIGAAVLLSSPDGGAVDFCFANDGIHLVHPAWVRYAKMSAMGVSGNPNISPVCKSLVITHSETPGPPGIASTSKTAEQILGMVLKEPVYTQIVDIPELRDAAHDPVTCTCIKSNESVVYDRIPGKYATRVGGLLVLGYKNMGKTCVDHIYQSKVIGPRVLQHLMIPRWNTPKVGGSCVVT